MPPYHCFNSMKVRLKPAEPPRAHTPSGFQFHEGPIKTEGPTPPTEAPSGFQFHEGPIKTLIVSTPLVPMLCFNSMKVRLKRASELAAANPTPVSIP